MLHRIIPARGEGKRMPRTCTICRSKQRAGIEAAILRQDPLKRIEARFKCSQGAIRHHRDHCITAKIRKYKDQSELEAGRTLIQELLELSQKAGEVLSRATAKKDGDLELKAIARMASLVELRARLLGQLEERAPSATRIEVHYVDKMVVAPNGPAQLPPASEPAPGSSP